ncbi:hypothetical protein LX64_00794 [Chitinophaga skermanii]|uniref:CHAT domain-containing protein n=1 Tax=Chitinophaga skermanii TaxID=331697 RepID=A0A327R2Y6_9BACT|nr:hypothetical protein [Chitinophaga skermanii]RAJ11186.1 hypothetical protein LX64_00794 [Chitinophaga skermanii]
MSFKKINIPNAANTGWEWPVKTGVIDLSKDGIVAVATDPNIIQYADVASLGAQQVYNWNVLLFDGIEEARHFFDHSKYLTQLNTSVIIIIEKESFFIRKDWGAIDKLSKNWTSLVDAGGLYYVQTALKLETWYARFMLELSLNKGVEEAMASFKGANVNVRAYVANDLNDRTKLSYFAVDLGQKLIKVHKTGPFIPINIELPGKGLVNMNLQDIGNYLQSNGESYQIEDGKVFAKVVSTISTKLKRIGFQLPSTADGEIELPNYIPEETPETKPPVIDDLDDLVITPGDEDSDERDNDDLPFEIDGDDDDVFGKSSGRGQTVPPTSLPSTPRGNNGGKTPVPPTGPAAPRYLRVAIFDENGNPIEDHLLAGNAFQMKISIGVDSPLWTRTNNQIREEQLFTDLTINRVNIDLVIDVLAEKKKYNRRILLPRSGDSTIALLDCIAANEAGVFEADIYAYHKTRLLQKVKYRVAITTPGEVVELEKPVLVTQIILNEDLNQLENRTDFTTSIYIDAKGSDDTVLPAMHNNKYIELRYASSIEKLVEKMKDTIEKGALFQDQTALNSEDNIKLLIKLANQGYMLYTNFLNEVKISGPIQLLSNQNEYLPIDLAYTFKAPLEDATLCEYAEEALMKGTTCQCVTKNVDHKKVVCPTGFWGLRYIVERHQFPTNVKGGEEDFKLTFSPSTSKGTLEVLNRTLYACTSKVNNVEPGSYDKMKKALHDRAPVTPREATGWANWLLEIPQVNPDTLILVVHIEENDDVGVQQLEIANQDFLTQTQFDESYLNVAANKQPPFVVLIGCESTDTNAYLFDTVSFIQRKGAAIVLSNFTKIKGEVATAIVIELVTILRDEAGKELRFGEVVLRLRQRLLAKGMMMSLTLLAHGDADWKIKVA